MWKISNRENKKILDDFRIRLIEPLFEEMINYKKINYKKSFCTYIDDGTNVKCKKSNELLKYINKNKLKNKKFSDLIQELMQNSSENEMLHYYEIYKQQNYSIDKFNYSIKADDIDEKVKEIFKIIFKDFFYGKFFDLEPLWKLIDKTKYDKEGFNREKFHENFKKENNLYICPYCDIDSTINNGNNEIEHFLPKSEYPFLAMNANNLISSCISCNKPYEGKGIKFKIPINSPFNLQMGDVIKFKNDITNRKIILSSDDDAINNYLEMLQLKKRYGRPQIYELVEDNAISIYDSISEKDDDITEDLVKKYIEKSKNRRKRKDTLTFALKGSFSGLNLYLKYRDDIDK